MIFLSDMILTFFSAYHDKDYNLVEGHKSISINYLKTWFTIDILAIFPFQLILDSKSDINGVIRIGRIGKLVKILRLTRIMRVFKVISKANNANLKKATGGYMKMDSHMEDLFTFLFSTLMICHIIACLWVYFTSFEKDNG